MDSYDFDINQGETFSLSLTLRNDDGTLMDLSNTSISGMIKTLYGDKAALANLNATIINEASGLVSVGLSSTQTAALPVNYAFYDIEMLNSGSNQVAKVLKGKVSIYPEVTY